MPQKPGIVDYGFADIIPGRGLRRAPGDVEIAEDHLHSKVNIECGNLQPGRRVWSEVFFIGTTLDEPRIISGHAFAATLPQPYEIALTVRASLTRHAFTVEDLIAAADGAME